MILASKTTFSSKNIKNSRPKAFKVVLRSFVNFDQGI